MHASDRSPCELAHRLHNVDVMVTPHGFQSMLLLFLPRPALLFEVFPYRYYKRGYGPLSDEYGVRHHRVMSPALHWMHRLILPQWATSGCMLSKQCRNFARNDDVLLTEHGVERFYEAVVELQLSCGRKQDQRPAVLNLIVSIVRSNVQIIQIIHLSLYIMHGSTFLLTEYLPRSLGESLWSYQNDMQGTKPPH